VGLERVHEAGIDVPDRMIDKAVRAVARSRTPEGTRGLHVRRVPSLRAPYGHQPEQGCSVSQPPLPLRPRPVRTSRGGAEHRKALEDLLVRHTRFQRVSARRPIPHESWYSISGYFYLYGHAYAAYVLEEYARRGTGAPVAGDGRRGAPLPPARRLLLAFWPSGLLAFWGYPLYSYHKPYGTALALIALSRRRLRFPFSVAVQMNGSSSSSTPKSSSKSKFGKTVVFGCSLRARTNG